MNGICVKSFLLAALIVLMGAAVQAEPVAKRLRIGTDATYPPVTNSRAPPARSPVSSLT